MSDEKTPSSLIGEHDLDPNIGFAKENTLQEILRKIDVVKQTAYRPDKYLRLVETTETVLVSNEVQSADGLEITSITIPYNCCKIVIEGSLKVISSGYNANVNLSTKNVNSSNGSISYSSISGYKINNNGSYSPYSYIINTSSTSAGGTNIYVTDRTTYFLQPGETYYITFSNATDYKSACNNIKVTYYLYEEAVTEEVFEVGSLKHHIYSKALATIFLDNYYPRLDRCEFGKTYGSSDGYLLTINMFGTEYVLNIPGYSYLKVLY